LLTRSDDSDPACEYVKAAVLFATLIRGLPDDPMIVVAAQHIPTAKFVSLFDTTGLIQRVPVDLLLAMRITERIAHLKPLAELAKNKTEFDLEPDPLIAKCLTDSVVAALLPNLINIVRVQISISHAAVVPIIEALTKYQKLTALHLRSTNINDLTLMSVFSGCPNIQELSIDSCSMITDKSLMYLSVVRNLRKLKLCDLNITNNTAKGLSQLNPKTMKELYLRAINQFSSGDSWRSLKPLISLQSLSFIDCKITCEDVAALTERMTSLRELVVQNAGAFSSQESTNSFIKRCAERNCQLSLA